MNFSEFSKHFVFMKGNVLSVSKLGILQSDTYGIPFLRVKIYKDN